LAGFSLADNADVSSLKTSYKSFGDQLDAVASATKWPRSKANRDNTLKYDAVDFFFKAVNQVMQMVFHYAEAAEVCLPL
jgi:hypothetical protein